MNENTVGNALETREGAFDINLLNKVTGTNLDDVPVYGANTLGQVLEEYAVDIGVNPNDSKIIFQNKRTGKETSDSNETIEGMELEKGDVLAISDNAGVA